MKRLPKFVGQRGPVLALAALALLVFGVALWVLWPGAPSEEDQIVAQLRAEQRAELRSQLSDRAYIRANTGRLNRLALSIQALEIELAAEQCLDKAKVAAHVAEADAVRIDYALRVGRTRSESAAALFGLAPFAGRIPEEWIDAETRIAAAPADCPPPQLQPMVTTIGENEGVGPSGM